MGKLTDKHNKLYPVTPLNVNVLDSIGNITNKLLYDDLKLFQHAKDSSVFKSNKEYFELYYQYLKHYEDLITNINITKEIVKTTTPTSSVKIAKDEYVEYYRLTDKYVFQKKKRLLEIKEILDNRESKSNFLSNLIFYPLEKTLDFIGFYD